MDAKDEECLKLAKAFKLKTPGCRKWHLFEYIETLACCDGCRDYIADVIILSDSFNEGNVTNFYSTSAGGDINAPINQGGAQNVGTNTVTVTRIEQSQQIQNQELKQLLAEGLKSIECSDKLGPGKALIISQYGALVEELEKKEPEKAKLERIWDGLKAVGEVLEPVAKLGGAIAKIYSLTLGVVT